jgi:hypothetical protein
MPYVSRNAQGRIVAVHETDPGAAEYVPAEAPEFQAALAALGSGGGSQGMQHDLEFVRVLEDVIELLIERHVIRVTDLPPAAAAKLMARRRWRDRLDACAAGYGDVAQAESDTLDALDAALSRIAAAPTRAPQ